MSLHPNFPSSPYEPLVPSQRWCPADETLRITAYEAASAARRKSSRRSLRLADCPIFRRVCHLSSLAPYWFETEHLIENADGSLSSFRYYFEANEHEKTLPIPNGYRPNLN
jgi:type III restriction enzyme